MRRTKLECWGPPVRFEAARHVFHRWHTPLAALGIGLVFVIATMILV
ncbi:MAG: hypothetical protein IH940_11830 [Acidobacteria bacterium]|nr:hypothetical protein [Acidobacteriota bacterium]